MSKRRRARMVITEPERRAVLASTVRMELLEHLLAVGPTTVAELAGRMGRSPNSLYRHVRLLSEAGFVRRVGSRQSGAREEAIHDAVAERIEVAVEADDAAGCEVERRTLGVILRQAEREFAAALRSEPETIRTGTFRVARARAPLSRTAQREVNRHLRAIEAVFSKEFARSPSRRARTRPCSITTVFVPAP